MLPTLIHATETNRMFGCYGNVGGFLFVSSQQLAIHGKINNTQKVAFHLVLYIRSKNAALNLKSVAI